MERLKPITIGNEAIIVHPLRPIDMIRINEIRTDIFAILNDEATTAFIPEKRLKNSEDAHDYMLKVVMSYKADISYTHFISDRENKRILGVINIISPKGAELNYKLPKYEWMIEYYLAKFAWNLGLMSSILPPIINSIKAQNIKSICAAVDKKNAASIRILQKNNFIKKSEFDLKQDYYQKILL